MAGHVASMQNPGLDLPRMVLLLLILQGLQQSLVKQVMFSRRSLLMLAILFLTACCARKLPVTHGLLIPVELNLICAQSLQSFKCDHHRCMLQSGSNDAGSAYQRLKDHEMVRAAADVS